MTEQDDSWLWVQYVSKSQIKTDDFCGIQVVNALVIHCVHLYSAVLYIQ